MDLATPQIHADFLTTTNCMSKSSHLSQLYFLHLKNRSYKIKLQYCLEDQHNVFFKLPATLDVLTKFVTIDAIWWKEN